MGDEEFPFELYDATPEVNTDDVLVAVYHEAGSMLDTLMYETEERGVYLDPTNGYDLAVYEGMLSRVEFLKMIRESIEDDLDREYVLDILAEDSSSLQRRLRDTIGAIALHKMQNSGNLAQYDIPAELEASRHVETERFKVVKALQEMLEADSDELYLEADFSVDEYAAVSDLPNQAAELERIQTALGNIPLVVTERSYIDPVDGTINRTTVTVRPKK